MIGQTLEERKWLVLVFALVAGPGYAQDDFARARSDALKTLPGDTREVLAVRQVENRHYRNIGRLFVSTAQKVPAQPASIGSIRYLVGSCTLLEGGRYVVTAYHLTEFRGPLRRLMSPRELERVERHREWTATEKQNLVDRQLKMPFDGPFKIQFATESPRGFVEFHGRRLTRHVVRHSPHANLANPRANRGFGFDYAILELPAEARLVGKTLSRRAALVKAGLRGLPPIPREWDTDRLQSSTFELAGYSGDEIGKAGTLLTSDRAARVTRGARAARRTRALQILRAFVYPGGSGGALIARSRGKLYWAGLPIAHGKGLATVTSVHVLYPEFAALGVLRR